MGYVSSVSSSVTAYEPVTTSGDVSFSGLGNGTDFTEIIDATIEAESYQLDEYEAQEAETQYIIDLLEQLESEIDSFNTSLNALDEPEEFYSMTGTSSDDGVSVDVTGEADTGTHTVVVEQLAQNDVWINTENGYSSEDAELTSAATTFEFTFGDETISLDVPAGTTLSGLETLVNSSLETQDKVEADLMYDGSNYYFVLKSVDTGADNTITITGTGTLDGFDLANFTNTQTGQNSKIKVDGFPAGADQWIERDTNSIDDVLDGITFDLTSTTDEDGATITIGYDTDAMAETITEFVAAANQIILDIQLLTGRVTEEEDSDEDVYTINSSVLDMVYSNIKSILSSGAQGFKAYDSETGGDTYNALSQIGFSTDTDEGSDTFGQIVVDEEDLAEALDNDPEAVAQLFCAKGEGESDSDDFQVVSVIEAVTPAGEHDVQYTISGGVITSATIDGEEATISGWTILGAGDDSLGLYISVNNRSDGDFDGTARVKQGKIGQLSDALDGISDEETGSLTILIDHYEESLTSIDNQIYNEEKRLDALETSLTRKYAALDSVLSELESTSTLLETLLADLE